MTAISNGKILALSGGVGGAKLARGLAEVLAPAQLNIVVNTADDFDYWGLRICPDLDSVMYALADRNDTVRGWGLQNESWRTLDAMGNLGAENWFQLGDLDLATHLFRSQRLREGQTLTQITEGLCKSMNVPARLLPMTEQAVATQVHCSEGQLGFQEYFVRERCAPVVKSLEFAGVESAKPTAAILATLADPDLRGIILCPSNPFLSIDPIFAVPGMLPAIIESQVPVIAVSPIVAGLAVKGPAAKLMQELNMPVSADQVARYYQQRYPGLLQGFIIDTSDAQLASEFDTLGLAVKVRPTLMTDIASKAELAEQCLGFLNELAN
ncbi:2-phospho-L-lactate transferase [Spongiibacter sp. KMU-158]|uniref:2-phospho-L-lactate transferase n=1 Tax=Spongiibacter pelagi TaxID=2760804 RepID=A0A927GVP8_9GAMM|nr:2-phospho-L-lactate transferase [Spongiibacter pelagi]MBD2858303.1 2-phospho-L-lactate transferase [Spongiibacter pelagi]